MQRVGTALLRLGDGANIVSARVLGHRALAQTDTARGDLDSADWHISAVESLAETWLGVSRMGGLAAHWEAGSPGAVLDLKPYALVLAHAGRIEEARDVAGT